MPQIPLAILPATHCLLLINFEEFALMPPTSFETAMLEPCPEEYEYDPAYDLNHSLFFVSDDTGNIFVKFLCGVLE